MHGSMHRLESPTAFDLIQVKTEPEVLTENETDKNYSLLEAKYHIKKEKEEIYDNRSNIVGYDPQENLFHEECILENIKCESDSNDNEITSTRNAENLKVNLEESFLKQEKEEALESTNCGTFEIREDSAYAHQQEIQYQYVCPYCNFEAHNEPILFEHIACEHYQNGSLLKACNQRAHRKRGGRKSRKKIFNFHLRRQVSSQEHIEENPPNQDSRTSPTQEMLPLGLPPRAARERCLQDLSKIISEERSYALTIQRERARLRIANENFIQREQRLEYMRRRSLQRRASESIEQRQQRLEYLRQHAAERMASESVEQRKQRLENLRRRVSQRIATESIEQREQRLEDLRQRVSQRVASENNEQCEQHQMIYEKVSHGVWPSTIK